MLNDEVLSQLTKGSSNYEEVYKLARIGKLANVSVFKKLQPFLQNDI